MIRSTARFDSDKSDRYLRQLCKHFAHKVPARWQQVAEGALEGTVDFPWGVCRLASGGNALAIVCEAEDDEALRRVEYVVADHVERFAWRDKPQLDWQRS